MYVPGKVVKAGSSYLSPPPDNGGGIPSKATTYMLDMTRPAPAWTQTASMSYARTHLNLTLLPDGSVLATGGSSDIGGVNTANAVYPAEIWSPVTQTWTTLASEQVPRLYHSTATLLPDGRVLVGGSGHNYYNNIAAFNSEIFSPPYLFKGARPTITSAPSTLAYGSSFYVGTPDGASIASVSLIRNGAVTHSFNMDQRYVPLTFQQTAGGLTVQAPADANLAPPGTYMLFMVNANGVPSVAPFVRLPAGYEDKTVPTAPTNLTAAGSLGSATLSWSAATDNNVVVRYNVHRSLTPGFQPGAQNLVGWTAALTYVQSGLAPGTYYYVVTAQDAAGNVGPASNEAAAIVTADGTAPTVALTAPAAGATVSGTATLTASASDNVGVAGVQFLLDGNVIGAEDTAAPYSITWNTNAAANGSHTLAARARDAAGNVTTSSLLTVTVSNTGPATLVGAWGFDEGAGTTAADASGNALNGSISGATWTTGGKFGSALSFNGASDWVTVADNNALDLARAMTIEAWVKPTSLGGWTTAVLKEPGAGMAYSLHASDGSGKPPAGYVSTGSADVSAPGTGAVPLNAWTHLAVTYDGANLRLYVNGALAGTKATTVAAASAGSATSCRAHRPHSPCNTLLCMIGIVTRT